MTDTDRDAPREPARKVAGMEYDFRRPTVARARSRAWNPDDPRLFTPKTLGWGNGVNLFWLVHPLRWAKGRQSEL